MKILQLTNKIPWPPKDGGAIATLTLTKGFSLLNHEITILAMNTLKHNIHINDIPKNIHALADIKLVDVPAKVTFTGIISNLLFSDLPYNATRFIDEGFSRKLLLLLKNKSFDVIQLEGLYLCPYIALIRQHSNALISYRAHNIEFEIWERSVKLASWPKRIYLKILSRRIKKMELSYLNEYDVLVSITERDGDLLDQLGNKCPRHTSQTGIDLSALIPTAKKLEYPSLFHIGALDWGPNQEGLLWFIKDCWPELHKLHPELKFYIAGRNAPQWLEKQTAVKGIHYMGEVDNAYNFMNSKAIMIVPLHSGSGMRIKIIEGMALSKAIVSTSIGAEGIPAIHEKNILIADDTASFIRAISDLIRDRELYEKLSRNAIRFIHENFDNLSITGELVDFYKKQHTHD